VGVQFDDNIFHLSPSQRDEPAAPSAAAIASGRYAGMENASDVLGLGSLAIQLTGRGIAGRSLEITPKLSYEFASRNQLRREFAGALTIAQSLGKGRRARFIAGAIPRHFSRNYLSDAVDANANGSITPEERVYARGQYSDYSVGGDLRMPLIARSKKGAMLTAGAGYYARSYDAPFSYRDLSGPTGMLALAFGQKRPVALELEYDVASLSATAARQILLLDEPSYNVDFNGNGRKTDLDARASVDTDRSRLEQQIGVGLVTDAGRRASVSLGYDYRLRSFRSELPYDENNARRRDSRSGFRGSIRTKLAKGFAMTAGARFLTQSTNRPLASAVGEEADYRNLIMSIGLQAAF